jgi:hypothetical protein
MLFDEQLPCLRLVVSVTSFPAGLQASAVDAMARRSSFRATLDGPAAEIGHVG